MTYLWNIFISLLMFLPWIAITLAALLALLRHKDSRILQMESVGAGGFFVLSIAQWVIAQFLNWTGAPRWLANGTHSLLSFFIFIALATFALGFCLEKLTRKNDPMQVTATRIDA